MLNRKSVVCAFCYLCHVRNPIVNHMICCEILLRILGYETNLLNFHIKYEPLLLISGPSFNSKSGLMHDYIQVQHVLSTRKDSFSPMPQRVRFNNSRYYKKTFKPYISSLIDRFINGFLQRDFCATPKPIYFYTGL